MQVLITGGAGFIGSNFVRFLVRERPNWKITVLDLLTYAGNINNISQLIDTKTISFVKADIANIQEVDQLFNQQKFDLVFNFAAESHVDRSIIGAHEFVRTNVLGTQNLLDAGKRTKISKYIQISTDEVYGSLGPTGRFLETTPLDPSSPYSASKAAADLMVLAFHKTHNFNAVITRCTNNYGPYHFPEKLIPLFITNALQDLELPLYGDGLNVRSWLYVEDHCQAILLVAEKASAGQVYNIGGSESAELTNLEVSKMILELLGKPDTLLRKVADRPAHDRRYAIDYSKIKNELGWEPRTSFKTGLANTVEWYKKNQEWWREIKSGEYQKYYQKNYGKR